MQIYVHHILLALVLYRVVTNTLGGYVSATQPTSMGVPSPLLMNTAEYVLEPLCVTLIHRAY